MTGLAAVGTTADFSFSSFCDEEERFEPKGWTFFRRPSELESNEFFDREDLVSVEEERSLDGKILPVEEDSSDPDLFSWDEAVVESSGVGFLPGCGETA